MNKKNLSLMTEEEVCKYKSFDIDSDIAESYNAWYAHAAKAAAHAFSAF